MSDVAELAARWAEGERTNDPEILDEVLHPDFLAVGPYGFKLTRLQWLRRYEAGLKVDSFEWKDAEIRVFGDSAISVGTQLQEATHQGNPAGGEFRVTHMYVRENGEWSIAGIHISLGGLPAKPEQGKP
ncbi:nuclear transport factor 2 family protein [Spirillospora sp. NPDC048911]|uniref:nuclear transport factor 2 family protein n=1 Tax=Spirillospora sp. NPDC048911 TaxID=3364527 RepID=UPI003721F251